MTLVTKCPHCHTAFKVTVDQLNLYDGAVRCGVCQQIFNGTKHLQQEKTNASLNKKEAVTAPLSQKVTHQESSNFLTSYEEDELSISLSDEDINALPEREALFQALEDELSIISLELEQVSDELFQNEINSIEEEDKVEQENYASLTTSNKPSLPKKTTIKAAPRFADLSLPQNLGKSPKNTLYSSAPHLDDANNLTTTKEDIEIEDLQTNSLQKSQFSSASYNEIDNEINKGLPSSLEFIKKSTQPPANEKKPNFIKTEKKQTSRIVSIIFLSLITLILFGTFSIQCLYMFSDRMIVWWPPSEPIISNACHVLACPRRLEARISALTIESSELQIIPELKNKYELSLLIRNSSSAYQSWPHLELTLTDQEKKTIIRKIFTPPDYLPNADLIMKGIPPYAEKSVGLYLEMQTESNADYRVSLFYP